MQRTDNPVPLLLVTNSVRSLLKFIIEAAEPFIELDQTIPLLLAAEIVPVVPDLTPATVHFSGAL
jgi:hypothetical protein